MTDEIRDSDFVALPDDHILREGVDWVVFEGTWERVRRLAGTMPCSIKGQCYCRRGDYPKPPPPLAEAIVDALLTVGIEPQVGDNLAVRRRTGRVGDYEDLAGRSRTSAINEVENVLRDRGVEE